MNVNKNSSKRHGVIAILDILGTQAIRQPKKAEQFLSNIENFYEQIDALSLVINKFYSGNYGPFFVSKLSTKNENLKENKMEMNVSTFSDTMIFAYYTNKKINDRVLLGLFGYFMNLLFSYAFINKIFVRGVISVGDFFLLNTERRFIIVGPAINEAAKLYESSKWIGISTTPSASLILNQKQQEIEKFTNRLLKYSYDDVKPEVVRFTNDIKKSFVPYNVPNKDEYKKEFAIAWPLMNQYTNEIIKIIEHKLKNNKLKQKSRKDDVYLKFKNTKDFYNFCMEQQK